MVLNVPETVRLIRDGEKGDMEVGEEGERYVICYTGKKERDMWYATQGRGREICDMLHREEGERYVICFKGKKERDMWYATQGRRREICDMLHREEGERYVICYTGKRERDMWYATQGRGRERYVICYTGKKERDMWYASQGRRREICDMLHREEGERYVICYTGKKERDMWYATQGRGREICDMLHCHHQNDSCIKVDKRHHERRRQLKYISWTPDLTGNAFVNPTRSQNLKWLANQFFKHASPPNHTECVYKGLAVQKTIIFWIKPEHMEKQKEEQGGQKGRRTQWI